MALGFALHFGREDITFTTHGLDDFRRPIEVGGSRQAAESAEDVIHGDTWIPIEDVALPFPDVELNSTAANRFVHGQEVVVFKTSVEDLEKDSSVVVRGADKRLLGIGTVRAVLARGRTLNIAPSMVLDTSSSITAKPKEQAGDLP